MTTILIADPIHPIGYEMLKDAGINVIDGTDNKNTVNDYIPTVDGLVVRSATKVTAILLENASKLKIIGRAGVGLDNIDLDFCSQKNIKVVNSPEGPTRSVAELTLGLLISVARKIAIVNSGTKNGLWPKKTRGSELFNKTIGVIGTGSIGGMFSRYCLALGMKVIAFNRSEKQYLKELNNFEYVSLEKVFTDSDFISLHLPLGAATRHLINEDAFKMMKEGVGIINTARGGLIDENALYKALERGKVMGAALDVFEQEPVDHSMPLIKHPVLITTPHVGAQTPEASKNNTIVTIEKIITFFVDK
jgi:D-3-phosphoglycerate dehydrogenase